MLEQVLGFGFFLLRNIYVRRHFTRDFQLLIAILSMMGGPG